MDEFGSCARKAKGKREQKRDREVGALFHSSISIDIHTYNSFMYIWLCFMHDYVYLVWALQH